MLWLTPWCLALVGANSPMVTAVGEEPKPLPDISELQRCIDLLSNESKKIIDLRSCVGENGIIMAFGTKSVGPLLDAAKAAKGARAKLRLVQMTCKVIEAEGNGAGATLSDGAFASLRQIATNTEEEFVARYWAIKALGRVKNEGAVAALDGVMTEKKSREVLQEQALQVQAIMAMGRTKQAEAELATHIKSVNFQVREAACDAFDDAKSKLAFSSLFRGLVDDDVRVRAAAIDALGKHTGDDQMGYYPDTPEEKAVRRWYDWMLAQRKLKWAPEGMAPFFKCSQPDIRVEVLGRMKGSEAPAVLFTYFAALTDRDKRVNAAALSNLKGIEGVEGMSFERPGDDEQWIPIRKAWFDFIWKRLGKWDWISEGRAARPAARAAICLHLKGVKNAKAVRFLYYMLFDPSDKIRTLAIRSLSYLKTEVFKDGRAFEFDPTASREMRMGQLPEVFDWLGKMKSEIPEH